MSLLFKISQALFRGWATNLSGPYMMGRTMNPIPSMTQGTWSGHRFPPAPRFHCYILPQGYKSLTTSRASLHKMASRQRGVCVKHLNRCKTSTFELTFQVFAGIISRDFKQWNFYFCAYLPGFVSIISSYSKQGESRAGGLIQLDSQPNASRRWVW